METENQNEEIRTVVENALPVSYYEVLLTKFLDFMGDESQSDLTLNKVINSTNINVFPIKNTFSRQRNKSPNSLIIYQQILTVC